MRVRLLRRPLSAKLSLLATLAVMLAVLALGINFELLLRESFLDSTRARMQHAYERLDDNLNKIEADLKVGVAFASQEEPLIASIELINQYQDKDRYNKELIDEEKKILAAEALERVKYSHNSDMVIYDQNNELLVFAWRKANIYHLGYVTFANGQSQIMTRTESGREFLPGSLPEEGRVGMRHVARAAAEAQTLEPLSAYQRLGDSLIIKSHTNVFAVASKRNLGHIELSHVLDDEFFARLSKDMDVKLTHAFKSALAGQPAELGLDSDVAAQGVSELAGQYVGVRRKSTLSDPVFFTVTLDKGRENALINSQRIQFLLILLAVGGITLYIMRFAFARILVEPLKLVMLQIQQIKQGNYTELATPATGDELEEISQSVNTLASTLARRDAELTEIEKKTKALANSLHEAQKIAQLGSWTLDLRSNVLHWSAEIFRLFELDPLAFKVSYESFLNAIHPDDRAAVDRAYTESLSNQSNYQIEHRLLMADGSIKWVSERCRSEFDSTGKPVRSLGTIQDVTERKLAELALAEALSLLKTVIDAIPMRVFWKDLQLNYLGCNTLFAQDAGQQTPADMVGKDDYQMGWAVHAAFYRADDQQVMDGGVGKIFYDEQQVTPQGNMMWLRTSKIPLKDQSGRIFGVLGVYDDITERKHAEELVRKLSQVAEQSPASVLITDLTGCIDYANEAFFRKTGYSRDDVIGKNPRFLHTDETPRSTYEAMWQSLTQGDVWSGELINRRKDGTWYTDWVKISPLRDALGVATHYVSVQEDITEKKRLADELDRHRHGLEQLVALRTTELTIARQQADASNRAKSEFLANMSHEIRTPMNGVIGMADVLAQTKLTSEQSRMLATINSSSMALLNILNDILDFSKIEAGKLDIEQIATPLREVVEGAAQLMLNTARSKDVEISVFVDPSLPEWIICDPTRLRQILLNLLGNALKFVSHRSGHALLHVQPCTHLDGSTCLHLSVIDNGIGMSPEVLAKLFQPFTQADASTVRRFGGTGLGLSITQRLVEMLHGRISVQSAPGVGSEFTVELPLQAATAPEGHIAPARPDLKGVNVLAISPSSACMTLFQTYLGSVGATVTALPDLTSAQSLLTQSSGSTVLLMDLTQAVGSEQNLHGGWKLDSRVVRLVRQRTSGTEAHGVEVQSRPLLLHDLLNGVALASNRLGLNPLVTNTAQASDSQRKAPSVEAAALAGQLILMAEDNETNREVMQEQLRLLGYACEVAIDGEQALAMWRAGLVGPRPRYALLLTDCHMPNLDGFELTAAIRQTESSVSSGTHLPIIAITANAMQGEAERCHDRGMDGYLCKPLRMRELGEMLNTWLPLAVGADQIPDLHAQARQPDEPLPIWDPETLTKLIGKNPAMHQRLLQKFMTGAHQQCSQIEAALTEGDLVTLTQVAHTLKSAARSVGALALGEICQAIEDAVRAQDQARYSALAHDVSSALAGAVQRINAHLAS